MARTPLSFEGASETSSLLPRPTSTSTATSTSRQWHSDAVKTIGAFGSVVLMVNNISGPAMLDLPKVFDAAGIIPTSLAIIVTCIISSFVATMLADAISSIPGNQKFDRDIEFSACFKIFLGHRSYLASQVVFYLCLITQNIAAIIATAQAVDSLFAQFLFGSSWALQFAPSLKAIHWSTSQCGDAVMCVPFEGEGTLILTAGYFLTAVVLLPFGLQQLKENMIIQKISFVFLIVLCAHFFFAFYEQGMQSENLNWFGDNYSHLIGIVLFNFAFPITIPCWLHEKTHEVSVNRTVWMSSIPSTILYLIFGIGGSAAFTKVSDNVLVALASSSQFGTVTKLAACLFGVCIIGLGIPILCVLMHNNLYSGGLFSRQTSLFMGGVLPYLLAWMAYQGHAAITLLAVTGVIFTGIVAFIGPMVVCYVAETNKSKLDITIRKGTKYHSIYSPSISESERRKHLDQQNGYGEGSVFPLPEVWREKKKLIISIMLVVLCVMVVMAIVVNIQESVTQF